MTGKMNDRKSVDSIVSTLKSIIDQNGPDILTREPYRVYSELVQSETADRKTAAALLHVLAAGVWNEAKPEPDQSMLSGKIQKECSLNKKMSDRLAEVFHALFSDENQEEWKELDRKGLEDFLKKELTVNWKGFAVWDAGNGTVDCHFKATIQLMPTEDAARESGLAKLLQKNPYTKEEEIRELFITGLCEYLDDEFEDYCTEEDYYQPVVEDFEVGYYVREWAGKNGFQLLSWDGSGDDDGYEPKHRGRWY